MKIEEVKKLLTRRDQLVARISHLRGTPAAEGADPVPPGIELAVSGATSHGDHSMINGAFGSNQAPEAGYTFYRLPAELVGKARELLLADWRKELNAMDLQLLLVEGIKP